MDDRLLDEMVIYGDPRSVGLALAARLRPLRPSSIGIALLSEDPLGALAPAAEALSVAHSLPLRKRC